MSTFNPQRLSILNVGFFQQSTIEVAQSLLGKQLVTLIDGKITSGCIVETEAYLFEDDSACHAARGVTPSNRSMFSDAGIAYVYPIHAQCCFNVVTQKAGEGTAVLVRSLRPMAGVATMIRRRGCDQLRDLCRGPGRICQAMGITRALDGHDLSQGDQVWIEAADVLELNSESVRATERIGVTSAKQKKLRFVVAGNRYVSGPARLG